ncbi:NAD(P)/FAD-dependent oxidoreductase [Blastopirellula marina]|uniref:FAD-dependent oxidoreductase n=1 Tax=Blastopirellula marina TaxID=124 RepID=A0A2S8FN24_9BACT|nr:FAD-dependent oxidoreductase [Blastopirellula marina]PQO33591.1 FAD-dependent oxidoreductase [Blastopirellula marina]PTL43378.1 FAD-dependent oxidoreductase [Blastopirellula marina]
MKRLRIAVIGGGISGNLVARLLHGDHDVTLFEAADYPGGHSNTVTCEVDGRSFDVDTGFMVFNERTYPNFCRLLEMLGVASQNSDMSFSVRCEGTGLEYQGSSLRGLFPAWKNVVSPSYWLMLRDILRFNDAGTHAVQQQAISYGETVGQFLNRCHVGQMFRDKYLLPMAAAIWSASPQQILDFPAQFFLGFCHNHGLMAIRNRPQWKTIVGGSKRYVQKLLEPLANRVRLNCPIKQVRREQNEVRVMTKSGEVQSFDRVVFATHADQTLRMLEYATPLEREILGRFPYQPNEAVLHTDTSLLPRHRHAWASWNYFLPAADQPTANVTYDLSRLQNVPSTQPILLSLNATERIDPAQVLATLQYDHPAYNQHSFAAQKCLPEIQGTHLAYFCGAWCGYGFHEDGVNSALAVAQHFHKNLDACKVASTKDGSPTRGTRPSNTNLNTV